MERRRCARTVVLSRPLATDTWRAATSTAPQIGKKRRMSDDDDEPFPTGSKRSRIGLAREDTIMEGSSQEQDATAQGVKEVTDGVREVELEEGTKKSITEVTVAAEEAATVPLPESPVLQAQSEPTEGSAPEATVEEKEKTVEQAEESNEGETVDVATEAEKPVVEDVEVATEEKKAEEEVPAVESATTLPVEAADTTPVTEEAVAEQKVEEVEKGAAA